MLLNPWKRMWLRILLGGALAGCGALAWGQVRLTVRDAQVSGGAVTELRPCFAFKPNRNWRFTVEPEGGTFLLARSGRVFFRAPQVATEQTFTLRLTENGESGRTVAVPITVLPDADPSGRPASRLPEPAAGASPATPEPAAGPAILVVDAHDPHLEAGPAEAAALLAAVCHLARDLKTGGCHGIQILRDGPGWESGASDLARRLKDLASAFPVKAVGVANSALAGAGSGATVILVTARPLSFLPLLAAWAQPGHRGRLVVVDAGASQGVAAGADAALEAFAQAWLGVSGPGMPLLFPLAELPGYRATFFWDGLGQDPLSAEPASPYLKHQVDRGWLNRRDQAWAQGYLASLGDWLPWRQDATLLAGRPSAAFIQPRVPRPRRVRVYLDNGGCQVPGSLLGALATALKQHLQAQLGANVEPILTAWPGVVPPKELLKYVQAGWSVHASTGGGSAAQLLAAAAGEARAASGGYGADAVCLLSEAGPALPCLNQLALDGHRVFLVRPGAPSGASRQAATALLEEDLDLGSLIPLPVDDGHTGTGGPHSMPGQSLDILSDVTTGGPSGPVALARFRGEALQPLGGCSRVFWTCAWTRPRTGCSSMTEPTCSRFRGGSRATSRRG